MLKILISLIISFTLISCANINTKNTNTINFNNVQEQYILQEITNILKNNFANQKNIGFIADSPMSKQLEIKLSSLGYIIEKPSNKTTNLNYYISSLEDNKIFLNMNFGNIKIGRIYLIKNNLIMPISPINIGNSSK